MMRRAQYRGEDQRWKGRKSLTNRCSRDRPSFLVTASPSPVGSRPGLDSSGLAVLRSGPQRDKCGGQSNQRHDYTAERQGRNSRPLRF